MTFIVGFIKVFTKHSTSSTNTGSQTCFLLNRQIKFCIDKLETLRSCGIEPIAVFDGGHLPSKKKTEEKRRNNREQCRIQSQQLRARGMHEKAKQKLIESTEVTTEMAYSFIKILKRRQIKFIVSPFEADAQLGFLAASNLADVVISEDSDILVYGAKKVFYKMDKDNYGIEIDLNEVLTNVESGFYGLSTDEFVKVCVLTGCDYSKSITKVGINKALTFFKKYKSFERVLF